MKPAHYGQPLVNTAADSRFARTLSQFLLSAERVGEHSRSRWIVHDLGLSDCDRQFIGGRFPWIELREFRFCQYPPHVALDRGSYAWKPIILGEAAETHGGPLLWFDSGTLLKKPFDEILEWLSRAGFWGLRSQMPLAQKCDPRVLDGLDVPLEVRHMREFAAGAVGFDTRLALGRSLVSAWRDHALIADHILPPDCASYHKHDQAILNCLLAKAAAGNAFDPPVGEIDISSANPSPLLSTRNFVPGGIPLWADGTLRALRGAWKFADRTYHRLRRFDDTHIDGFRRWRKEHFTVMLRSGSTGKTAAIASPRYGYFADPFVHVRDGRTWVFVERFSYADDRGSLAVLSVDETGGVVSSDPIVFVPEHVRLDCHASYPFVFEHEGLMYMIPETHERRAVDLFVNERWPDRWRLVRRLLFGVDAADSMVIRHADVWYLLTSVRRDRPNRHLEIYFSSDLFAASFAAHPVNSAQLYGEKRHGTGRNAGFLGRMADGTLARLMQASPNHYGEGICPMRILELTERSFQEEPVDLIGDFPDFPRGFASHHVSRHMGATAFDVRDRVR